MKELGWDKGQDDEELFEFAMHEKQYREFKSGQAKDQFIKDLTERMDKAGKDMSKVCVEWQGNLRTSISYKD